MASLKSTAEAIQYGCGSTCDIVTQWCSRSDVTTSFVLWAVVTTAGTVQGVLAHKLGGLSSEFDVKLCAMT